MTEKNVIVAFLAVVPAERRPSNADAINGVLVENISTMIERFSANTNSNLRNAP